MRPKCILGCCVDIDAASPPPASFGETLTRRAMELQGFEFAHMAINLPAGSPPEAVAGQFNALFGFPVRAGNTWFASDSIEIGNGTLGSHGHIGIISACVERAIPFLARQGLKFRWETLQKRDGRPTFLFLEKEIAGFAVHVAQYI